MRYVGRKAETVLGSSTYDFYKICLQDHAILATLKGFPQLGLLPFSLYIVTHELIHVIRFTKFLQAFEASPQQKMAEEARVHEKTRAILLPVPIRGMDAVFDFYGEWKGLLDVINDV
jgi:hypothetical protein